ncbi:MAG: hypothetical protein LBV79_03760 [Candidatus Adiutrix sp.]|jgi:hypothetical protein|nr:hypothetical protein [Candidatus Adiutrix sp.]
MYNEKCWFLSISAVTPAKAGAYTFLFVPYSIPSRSHLVIPAKAGIHAFLLVPPSMPLIAPAAPPCLVIPAEAGIHFQ